MSLVAGSPQKGKVSIFYFLLAIRFVRLVNVAFSVLFVERATCLLPIYVPDKKFGFELHFSRFFGPKISPKILDRFSSSLVFLGVFAKLPPFSCFASPPYPESIGPFPSIPSGRPGSSTRRGSRTWPRAWPSWR